MNSLLVARGIVYSLLVARGIVYSLLVARGIVYSLLVARGIVYSLLVARGIVYSLCWLLVVVELYTQSSLILGLSVTQISPEHAPRICGASG